MVSGFGEKLRFLMSFVYVSGEIVEISHEFSVCFK